MKLAQEMARVKTALLQAKSSRDKLHSEPHSEDFLYIWGSMFDEDIHRLGKKLIRKETKQKLYFWCRGSGW